MDVGIGIPNSIPGTTGPDMLEWARRAESAGFSTLALMATLPGLPLYRSWGFGDERPQDVAMPDGVRLAGVTMSRPITQS